ncbi:MAG TPA: caspase family protein [Xanthobacteraceae bacterium]|nr:caspase family protein [Xanthobacteraceae bacterium]
MLLHVFISITAVLFAVHTASASEPRTALIIGNATYGGTATLKNPTNDATDMAAVLRNAGFDVILQTDADQRGMKDAIRSFHSALRSKGGVGLFFFSGHGVQSAGENYLIPVNERIANENEVRQRSVSAAEAVDAMAGARNGLNIVVLDACRNNALPGTNATSGLSRIDSNASLFVSYATSPGSVALDGSGRNSPYTKHLTQAIDAPGLSLEETFKRTLKGVYQETQGSQTPWISSSFFGEFIFKSGQPATGSMIPPPAPITVQPVVTSAAVQAATLGGIYRTVGTNPNGTRYRGTVALLANGNRVGFIWWINKDTFTGIGEFAGRMLVVEWSAKHPVTYTFNREGRLDGEWADGSATDRLQLFARSASTPMVPAEGVYRVAGKNPDNSSYEGRLVVARMSNSNRYRFSWTVGSSTFRGTGVLQGNIVAVDWGQAQPMVYALGEDGVLRGLWSGGAGEEVATPERI